MPGFVLLSAFVSAMSIPVPDLSAPPLLFLWLCLGRPLLCLCQLCAWARSSVHVCVCCVSVLVPGLSAPPSAFAMSLALSKALKKEPINIAFLDLLGNHVQSAGSFRSIACSPTCPIALPKICGLYKAPNLVLGSQGLNAESHVITHQAKTIWI